MANITKAQADAANYHMPKGKVSCPLCHKSVSKIGLSEHVIASHPELAMDAYGVVFVLLKSEKNKRS